jgi:hypothetical protein
MTRNKLARLLGAIACSALLSAGPVLCRSPRPLGQAVTATIRPPVARNTRVSV